MPKFAANLTMFFTEVPFMERFASARGAGFSAIEYLFPYEFEVAELKAQLGKNRLTQVLFNLPAGKWEEGERGIAAIRNESKNFVPELQKQWCMLLNSEWASSIVWPVREYTVMMTTNNGQPWLGMCAMRQKHCRKRVCD